MTALDLLGLDYNLLQGAKAQGVTPLPGLDFLTALPTKGARTATSLVGSHSILSEKHCRVHGAKPHSEQHACTVTLSEACNSFRGTPAREARLTCSLPRMQADVPAALAPVTSKVGDVGQSVADAISSTASALTGAKLGRKF